MEQLYEPSVNLLVTVQKNRMNATEDRLEARPRTRIPLREEGQRNSTYHDHVIVDMIASLL